MKKKQHTKTLILSLILVLAVVTEKSLANASASLSQARNGAEATPSNPIQWVNGNLGLANAHYSEGMSSPYQCLMTGLTPSVQITLTIGYDIRNSSKNAFDYLTYYNRLLPHLFVDHVEPETIDPLSGSGLAAATPFTTYTIPMPSATGTTVAGQPTDSYNALSSNEHKMTLFNGTIDSIYYLVEGNLSANQSETQIVVKFTPSAATAVLAWGGHIASRADWGYTSGSPRSAGGISGSPFHMRLVSWNLGSLGNQDRSISGYTVLPPPNSLPVSLIHFAVDENEKSNEVDWTTASEINNDHFTVERASADLNFKKVYEVDGAGNSTSLRNYNWTDSEPLNGLSYYRLIQTDYDGKHTVFGPIPVNKHGKRLDLTVMNTFPNPFVSDIAITFYSATEAVTRVQIMDAGGRKIQEESFNAAKGINLFDCKNLNLNSEGVYFIMLSQGELKSEAMRILKK